MEELPPMGWHPELFAATQEDNIVLKVVLLLLLVVGSALVSGAEVAFFSLSTKDIDHLKEENSVSGKLITRLLSNSKRLLATILIANNAINIAFVLLFDTAHFFTNLPNVVWFGFLSANFIIEISVVTLILLVFGEIFPKIYANSHSISFARFMCWPLYLLDLIFKPLSVPMYKISDYLQKRLGREKSNLSVDHLSQALELTAKEETTKQEETMLKGIVSFGNTETKQIMSPRVDMFAVDEKMKFSELIEEILREGFSRIPIYNENQDNIIGILYSKDLLQHIDKETFDWLALRRDAYFVPENKKLDILLKEFQEKKIHLAIVVDEYGGTSGLVTLEDIIEEIVGDISDESDVRKDAFYEKIDDCNFVFEGKTLLKDFYRVLRLEDDIIFEDAKGESETLAGLVLEIAGAFPEKGDKISFGDYTFEVLKVDERRIKKIKIILPSSHKTSS